MFCIFPYTPWLSIVVNNLKCQSLNFFKSREKLHFLRLYYIQHCLSLFSSQAINISRKIYVVSQLQTIERISSLTKIGRNELQEEQSPWCRALLFLISQNYDNKTKIFHTHHFLKNYPHKDKNFFFLTLPFSVNTAICFHSLCLSTIHICKILFIKYLFLKQLS